MPWMLIGLVVVVLVVLGLLGAVAAALPKGEEKHESVLMYAACGPLLSEAELAFYPVLVDAARAGAEPCLVMCKVRLGDLIRPEKGLDRSAATSLRNRANQKHVDFVVVRAADFGVVAAVELDDASHRQKKRRERDAYVDAALGAAGIRVAHVPWGRGHSLEDVAGRLWSRWQNQSG